jgi:hypothetical protein
MIAPQPSKISLADEMLEGHTRRVLGVLARPGNRQCPCPLSRVKLPRQPAIGEAADDPSRHVAPLNCCCAK